MSRQYGVSVMFKTGQTVMWVYNAERHAKMHAYKVLDTYQDCIVVLGDVITNKKVPQKSHKKNTKRP